MSSTTSVDCYDLNRIISGSMDGTKGELRASLQILAELTNYHLNPNDPDEPFQPMRLINGKRTSIPSDLPLEQMNHLAKFVPKVQNAGLRARIADVVWFVQRNREDIAEMAVSAYCDCLEQVRVGTATIAFGDQISMERPRYRTIDSSS